MIILIKEGIQKITTGLKLTRKELRVIMKEIMSGDATQAQIGALLTALRMKGETIEEITVFATIMKEFCHQIFPRVHGRLVDTCGTGGDKIKTFNISTTAAFMVAGAGIPVAKHGNRSVTSRSGSADVLETLGLNLSVTPQVVKKEIEKVGIGFMFAPVFHPAMKYAIGPRREIGLRTVFNVLGPLTNPANANAQLIGVYDKKLVKTLAHVLKNLSCQEAMVVHGLDVLDEISTIGKTAIAWLRDGEVKMLEMAPKDFGFKTASPEDIRGSTPKESAETTFRILNGHCAEEDSKLDIVLVNAAAGTILGGKADDFNYGIEASRESIESGAAYEKLKAVIKISNGDRSKLEELETRYD